MIDRDLYAAAMQRAWRIRHSRQPGGQELILAEIIGCMKGCSRIWLPFVSNATLLRSLHVMGFATWNDAETENGELWANIDEQQLRDAGCDAVYFGTPTIVDDQPLFPDSISHPEQWTKEFERQVVRQTVRIAEAAGLKRIVCGLGSGDIAIGERYYDVGSHAHAVAMKRFVDETGADFTDFVIVRQLNP